MSMVPRQMKKIQGTFQVRSLAAFPDLGFGNGSRLEGRFSPFHFNSQPLLLHVQPYSSSIPQKIDVLPGTSSDVSSASLCGKALYMQGKQLDQCTPSAPNRDCDTSVTSDTSGSDWSSQDIDSVLTMDPDDPDAADPTFPDIQIQLPGKHLLPLRRKSTRIRTRGIRLTHEPPQPTIEEKAEDPDCSEDNASHQSLLAVKFPRCREFQSDSDESSASDEGSTGDAWTQCPPAKPLHFAGPKKDTATQSNDDRVAPQATGTATGTTPTPPQKNAAPTKDSGVGGMPQLSRKPGNINLWTPQ